jgi:flagellar biosynthesis GTPase FlhF
MPSIMATIGANATTFFSTMRGVEGHVKNFGANIKRNIGGKLSGFFSMSNLEQSAAAMLELGGRVQDISNRLGISTDAVQKWDYALKQNGSSIEEAMPFFNKLAQARQKALEGNDKSIASFQALGVSLDDLKTKRIEDIAQTIASAFESGDPQQLMAAMVDVGGKGGMSMAAAFRDGLAEALDEAPIISAEHIANLDAAADKIGRMKADAAAAWAPVVSGAATMAQALGDGVYVLSSALMGLFSGNGFAKGADEANAELTKRDAEAKAKAERLKKGNTAAFDPDGIEDKDAIKEAEKSQKEQEKADKKAAADKARAEKQAKKEEADLSRDVDNEIAKEEANNVSLTKREGSAGFGYGGVHAGMSAGPELSAMNAQLRTEEHLREIKEMIKKNKGKVTEDSGDVEYE